MPLLDHFHAPLFPRYPWESFHSFWAVAIAGALNQLLPPRFLATVHTHLGPQVEADVTEFEHAAAVGENPANGPPGGVAVQTWAPPVATRVMSAVFPDDLEVEIRDEEEDARLVAVVELVSPRNKDRAEARRAFAAKCAAYLQRGTGLVTVDIVTSRHFNLHNELVELMGQAQGLALPAETVIYAVGYRPVYRQGKDEIDLWSVPLTVGGTLPVLALALRGTGTVVLLDLEATYMDARQRSRL
jgi:Protein of unknown function (DUF4058)